MLAVGVLGNEETNPPDDARAVACGSWQTKETAAAITCRRDNGRGRQREKHAARYAAASYSSRAKAAQWNDGVTTVERRRPVRQDMPVGAGERQAQQPAQRELHCFWGPPVWREGF